MVSLNVLHTLYIHTRGRINDSLAYLLLMALGKIGKGRRLYRKVMQFQCCKQRSKKMIGRLKDLNLKLIQCFEWQHCDIVSATPLECFLQKSHITQCKIGPHLVKIRTLMAI